MKKINTMFESLKNVNIGISVVALLMVFIGIGIVASPIVANAQTNETAQEQAVQQETKKETDASAKAKAWAFMAAGLTLGVSVLGAGIALSKIGSAAIGAMSEKPELMGRTIVFAGLAEGLSIWGLIVAVLILGKV